MSISPLTTNARRVLASSGCGTIESPWTNWEDQIEVGLETTERDFVFPPGFYAVNRTVHLPSRCRIDVDPEEDGRAWFVPGSEPVEALFAIAGAQDVRIGGICLNGRASNTRFGIQVTAGEGIHIENCRFGDFTHNDGAAIRLGARESNDSIREVVVQHCRVLNGHSGVSFGAAASDALITNNRFEELAGPALSIDPGDRWAEYGMLFVKNLIAVARMPHEGPHVRILPGAEGIRLAENVIEHATPSASGYPAAAIEIQGGGPLSSRRIEVLTNRIVGGFGPGIAARECGPGFVVAGNHLLQGGSPDSSSVHLVACHGALVEDNEIINPLGSGIHAHDCAATRLNGNDVQGPADAEQPPRAYGLLVDGANSRRLRVTDNRVARVRNQGLWVNASNGIRLVGNEVTECGEGIRISTAKSVLCVGNDCRDNHGKGIVLDREVERGLVALNYSILNREQDLEIVGERIRSHSNKVDRAELAPNTAG